MSTTVFRDSVSGFTHLGGAIAAVVGTVFLALKADTPVQLAAYIIFGVSMVLLFSSSATYHLINCSDRVIQAFRKLDHSMIYVFIAGSYTPIIVQAFTSTMQTIYMVGVWTVAAVGVVLKMFLTGKFRVFFTSLYILMGWSGIFAIVPLAKTLGLWGIVLLLVGGAMYTIGGVLYACKWPKMCRAFGFHELFHIFVLLGATAMFFTIYFFI